MPVVRARRACCALLALAASLLAAAAGAVPALAVEKGLVTDISWKIPDADKQRTADALRELGARWTRINVNWWWLDAEPSAAWADLDRSVQLARRSGARILFMVDHSPSWASGSDDPVAPPKDPSAYAGFMGRLAERYRDQVDAYEIWNEPNLDWNWPSPDPAAYARLLKAAAPAIRAADPGATIVFGGLGGNDVAFVERAYDAEPGLSDSFDAVGVHPYPTGGTAPELDVLDGDGKIGVGTFKGYRRILDVVAEHGERKPAWLTEFGWSTTTQSTVLGGVSAEVQAEYLTRAYELLDADPDVAVALWYSLRNHFWAADDDTWGDQLGLMHTDFSPKPAYDAFRAIDPPVVQAAGEADPSAVAAPEARVAERRRPHPILELRIRRRRAHAEVVATGRAAAGAGRVTVRLHGRRGSWTRRRVEVAHVGADGRFRLRLVVRRHARWTVLVASGDGRRVTRRFSS